MKKAIQEHAGHMIALAGLLVLSLIAGYIITQNQRLRIPVFQERPFAANIELETAQALEGGQGQTVRVAGVEVGSIQGVELRNGKALARVAINREFLPVYQNATALMRPKTALKDMFIELDPGDPSAPQLEENGIIPSANTAPDINLDEVLNALDADTRDYLRILITSAGKGLAGRNKQLGELLRQFGPLNRNLASVNGQLAQRRTNISRFIHNFQELMGEVRTKDDEIPQLVDASNAVFEAFSSESDDLREAVRLLPGTLRETRTAFDKTEQLAIELQPTLQQLQPFARRLDDMNDALRPFARETTPIIRDEVRPLVRAAREPVQDLAPIARRLERSTPDLDTLFNRLNNFTNMLAYNPKGAEPPGTPQRDEGYLFWLAWFAHNGNSVFNTQDAHGVIRRLYLSLTCETIAALFLRDPFFATLEGFGVTGGAVCGGATG